MIPYHNQTHETRLWTMTPEQEAHLGRIKKSFLLEADTKYRKGQREHGGDLFKKGIRNLLIDMKEEAIDQYVYAHTALESLDEIYTRAEELEKLTNDLLSSRTPQE